MSNKLPKNAGSTFLALFLRSYSRRTKDGLRETWEQAIERAFTGLNKLAGYTPYQAELILHSMLNLEVLPSGRWMWVGGTKWIEDPKNFVGSYNCSSINLDHPSVFGLAMDSSMQGTGVGCVVEARYIDKLPLVKRLLNIVVTGEFGGNFLPLDETTIETTDEGQVGTTSGLLMTVGDSREGWVGAYQGVIDLAMMPLDVDENSTINLTIDISSVRPKGKALKGFGGVSNPNSLPGLFPRMAQILNGCANRDGKLTSVECCLLVDESAKVVVAGNIRRSAGIKQGSSDDLEFAVAKDDLWIENNGRWSIDPDRDAHRMSNHTRVYHHVPTLSEIKSAVQKQVLSGEGAIQYAPEAIARCNVDLLDTEIKKDRFLALYEIDPKRASEYVTSFAPLESDRVKEHRMQRYGGNPCFEIIGSNFLCNLAEIHLKTLNPFDFNAQKNAFKVGGWMTAALLKHKFPNPRLQFSRETDPIVGVSFTGLFDFFVNAFGLPWLKWWESGRSNDFDDLDVNDSLCKLYGSFIPGKRRSLDTASIYRSLEKMYLTMWKEAATNAVWAYCDTNELRRPNRCTALQPAGSKSLLTDSSPGWHPPKGSCYIRRITYGRDEPLALALMDLGYKVIPGQVDKDEFGGLLEDPFDPRCTEWLVEIPVQTSSGAIEGADEIDFNKFSATAQLDFYMEVQNFYSAHTTSATIELRPDEVDEFSEALHEQIGKGFMSAALLARFDSPFPRLPFEVISKEDYEVEMKAVTERAKILPGDFYEALEKYDNPGIELQGPAQCDSAGCLMPQSK